MKILIASAVILSFSVSLAFAQTNPNCKVVQLKKGEAAPAMSGMSTSITAGNGEVSGTTSVPGGPTVSQSGSGSFSTSSASDGKSTVVTDSNGNCTVYRKAED